MPRFQKGQSGNPSGRPKRGWTWAKVLEDTSAEIEPKSGKPLYELVAKRLWVAAIGGDIAAIKELFNRMDGMPKQPIVNDEDGNAFVISVLNHEINIPKLRQATTTPDTSNPE